MRTYKKAPKERKRSLRQSKDCGQTSYTTYNRLSTDTCVFRTVILQYKYKETGQSLSQKTGDIWSWDKM